VFIFIVSAGYHLTAVSLEALVYSLGMDCMENTVCSSSSVVTYLQQWIFSAGSLSAVMSQRFEQY
jgi:hypothetical protein